MKGFGIITLVIALLGGTGAFAGGWWVGSKVEQGKISLAAQQQARKAEREKARIEREAIEREAAIESHFQGIIDGMNRRVEEALDRAAKDREIAQASKERLRILESELQTTPTGFSECRIDPADVRMLNRASATANRAGLPGTD